MLGKGLRNTLMCASISPALSSRGLISSLKVSMRLSSSSFGSARISSWVSGSRSDMRQLNHGALKTYKTSRAFLAQVRSVANQAITSMATSVNHATVISRTIDTPKALVAPFTPQCLLRCTLSGTRPGWSFLDSNTQTLSIAEAYR